MKLIEFRTPGDYGKPAGKISINPATIVCIKPALNLESKEMECLIRLKYIPYEVYVLHTYETVRDWIQQL